MTASGPDQALERFRIIRPFLEEGIALAAIARQHGIALRTARRWVSHYRAGGLAAMTRPPGPTKVPAAPCPHALQELVEALALTTPRRSVAAMHRTVAAVARDRGDTPPSYAAVYALVRALDPALLTLAHQGAKVYSETYDLLYRREVDAPNALWQADHTLLDLLVLDEQGVPVRPWLSVIVDDYSRVSPGISSHSPCRRPCKPLWRSIRRSGASANPGGPCAGFRGSCTRITAVISRPDISSRSAPSSKSASCSRCLANRAGADGWSASLPPSTNASWPTCPAMLLLASRNVPRR